jgi:hypothetical protein
MKGFQTLGEASNPSKRVSCSSEHVSLNYFGVYFATMNLYMDPESQSGSTDPNFDPDTIRIRNTSSFKENFVFLISFLF